MFKHNLPRTKPLYQWFYYSIFSIICAEPIILRQ